MSPSQYGGYDPRLVTEWLVGKNCHSSPKEPQEDFKGNRDESPSQKVPDISLTRTAVSDIRAMISSSESSGVE
ncbi:hypothetical protein TNCV_4730171 [Trichonephila clavipes]|nr:hypothetical protein TNCV_4730171 [Trichonephila clavipes]